MQFVVDTVGGANEPQKPHEISVRDLAEQLNCSDDMARDKLDKMVRAGLMDRRYAKGKSKAPIIVYYKKDV